MNTSTVVLRGLWGRIGLATLFSVSALGAAVHADDFALSVSTPPCATRDFANLPVNNLQVIGWKHTTPNQHLERAHVTGQIKDLYDSRNGHLHFSIQLDRNDGTQPHESDDPRFNDRLEVVYNVDFGNMVPQVGMQVEACGDYITSFADSKLYTASPDAAIIHWVHKSPDLQKHYSGYVMLTETDSSGNRVSHLYGQDAEHAGPKSGGFTIDSIQ